MKSKQKQYKYKSYKSAAPQKNWGHIILAPIAWIVKSLAWLMNSEKWGGAKFTFYMLALYAFLLSTETIYSAMPHLEGRVRRDAELAATVKFLPKPVINDLADPSLLMPPMWWLVKGQIWNNIVGPIVPFHEPKPVQLRWTLWQDPRFYIAVALAALIGSIEAKAIRRTRLGWEVKARAFQELNSLELPDLNPKAVMAAGMARQELAAHGSSNYVMGMLVVIGVYAVEALAFIASLSTLEVSALATIIYGLIDIFGFEIAWELARDLEEEEVEAFTKTKESSSQKGKDTNGNEGEGNYFRAY